MKTLKTQIVNLLLISLASLCWAQEQSTTLFEEDIPPTIEECEVKLAEARAFITGSLTVLKDGYRALEILQPCIEAKDPEALHTVAVLYFGGNQAIRSDYKKGVELLREASNLGHAEATTNLAIAYHMGKGVKLNFNKARELYEKAYDLGSDKAAFKLGYLYFKGLGSIPQDYQKSLEWFKKSEYPMAQYWLGIQYYFGYGVAVDKAKAEEIMVESVGTNTKRLLHYLFTSEAPKVTPTAIISDIESLEDPTSENNRIANATIEAETTTDEPSKKLHLKGKWKGKLVELDWSQTKIVRSFPVELNFESDKAVGSLDYSFTINETTTKNFGILLGNEYYFEKLSFKLPRLYKDAFPFTSLDYDINTATFEQTEIEHLNYLTANIDGHISQWNEPSPPMKLVLVQTGATTENGEEINQELLQALASQQDDGFITLYPNPFKTDLLISYELTETSDVSVLLYSFEEQTQFVIEAGMQQEPKEYIYHFDGSQLRTGLYVVRITANGTTHTKLVIKK